LIIKTKSLNTDSNFKLTYFGNFFDSSSSDILKTYSIRVSDKVSPILTYYDISGRIRTNLTYFKHFFPRTRLFNFLTDICLIKLDNFITISNNYVDNKPVLLYTDNSIYDLCNSDLSFNFITSTVPNNIIRNLNELSLNSIMDSSCIINYRIKDLCNNYSQGISLELNFVNIPDVILRGSSIRTFNYINDLSFSDDGLTFNGSVLYTRSLTYSKNYLIDNSSIIIGSDTYSINSNASDICFTRLGIYYFNYTITQTSAILPSSIILTRLIKIIDNSNIILIFPPSCHSRSYIF
jgi:hypothetical protein